MVSVPMQQSPFTSGHYEMMRQYPSTVYTLIRPWGHYSLPKLLLEAMRLEPFYHVAMQIHKTRELRMFSLPTLPSIRAWSFVLTLVKLRSNSDEVSEVVWTCSWCNWRQKQAWFDDGYRELQFSLLEHDWRENKSSAELKGWKKLPC